MNLIKEINAFYKLDMPGQLSFTAQSLYMALLYKANEVYSRDITPSNPLLMAMTGIRDVKTLDKARKELIEINLIEYADNAKSRLAGHYRIIGLESLLVDNFQKNSGKIPEETPEKFLGSPGKKPPHIQEENIREETIETPLPPAEDKQEPDPPVEEKPRPPFKSKKQEQLFDQFWTGYPKKKSKGQAETTWVKICPDDLLFKRIINGLDIARGSPDWKRDKGQYIPHPSTWLNAKGWEDEYGQGAQEVQAQGVKHYESPEEKMARISRELEAEQNGSETSGPDYNQDSDSLPGL